jgi:hypothetical protein
MATQYLQLELNDTFNEAGQKMMRCFATVTRRVARGTDGDGYVINKRGLRGLSLKAKVPRSELMALDD